MSNSQNIIVGSTGLSAGIGTILGSICGIATSDFQHKTGVGLVTGAAFGATSGLVCQQLTSQSSIVQNTVSYFADTPEKVLALLDAKNYPICCSVAGATVGLGTGAACNDIPTGVVIGGVNGAVIGTGLKTIVKEIPIVQIVEQVLTDVIKNPAQTNQSQ